MPKKTPKKLRPLIDTLEQQLRKKAFGGQAIYADLEGNTYDVDQYVTRLKDDEGFAIEQLGHSIRAPQSVDAGITPREQLTLANRVAKFADAQQLNGDGILAEFLKSNEVLRETYSREDWAEVVKTLKHEFKIDTSLDVEARTPK
ncbi:MAG: hypothetical protein LC732_09860, partial [Acidobacteria bacterium]|nr:hypothetical protein [Acidobacteriota bacterium]